MLQIYNTLTRKKEIFKPIQAGRVSMYVCGMTVYDYCHLGHARVLVGFDVITRYLRAQDWDVTYVRNITDIDDKILNRAKERGVDYRELTKTFIDCMHEDEESLSVLRPDHEPRATGHIDDIVNMVEVLIDKGFAYLADNGDVYYRVEAFTNYGQLSGKNLDELKAGARIAVDEAKQDPRDFALWKAASEGEVYWPSPWGNGRPGWHIECSAMSTCCLGDTFDIHGGGPDLSFPHHENEIAQSEAATGHKYVNYWMHAGAVRVDNEKMSKSLGNFFTIREILEKYHPEVVRYFLVSSHYRSAINYSEDNLKIARSALERFYTALLGFDQVPVKALKDLDRENDYVRRFIASMDDDFNTPEALAILFELVRELNTQKSKDEAKANALATALKSLASVFGLLETPAQEFLQGSTGSASTHLSADAIDALIAQREQAKLDKNYARADEIREQLQAKGVVLEDSREGTRWRRAD